MIIAVCGVKNSGKTTLLENLIKGLTEKGKKVAVIKHDGHDFECDIPDTDSYRMSKAGAYGTAVYSAQRMFIHKQIPGVRSEDLIAMFPEADIIFIEGLKVSSYPKIEVIRKEISDCPVSNPEGRFLIVTDWEDGKFQEETKKFEDIEGIIAKISDITN
ncbi:MAG: molybdopterin-guanine dinucleotide biosynthesis protein B [Ruminococcus sp.]|nr:molybdopterin-guanine dinucleotide biosynthesis protein B [Ruminococcus sp.]